MQKFCTKKFLVKGRMLPRPEVDQTPLLSDFGGVFETIKATVRCQWFTAANVKLLVTRRRSTGSGPSGINTKQPDLSGASHVIRLYIEIVPVKRVSSRQVQLTGEWHSIQV